MAAERLPKVVAIVCTISRPRELSLCIGSILANSYQPFEVIVVDQNPGPVIREALTLYLDADRRLRYIHAEQAGKTRAQNLAIRESDADLFVFTDDDCLVPADWIDRVVATFARLPDAGLLFGEVLPPAGHDWAVDFCPLLEISHEHRLRPAFLPRVNYLFGCSMAVRRATFERIGLFDATLGPGGVLAPANEEVDFHLRALRAKPPVGVYLTPAFNVVHAHGSRRQGQAARTLLRSYEFGKSAMLTKHALKGDIGAACKLGLLAFEPLVDGIVNLIRTGRPRGAGMLVPYVGGIRQALRLHGAHKVDGIGSTSNGGKCR